MSRDAPKQELSYQSAVFRYVAPLEAAGQDGYLHPRIAVPIRKWAKRNGTCAFPRGPVCFKGGEISLLHRQRGPGWANSVTHFCLDFRMTRYTGRNHDVYLHHPGHSSGGGTRIEDLRILPAYGHAHR